MASHGREGDPLVPGAVKVGEKELMATASIREDPSSTGKAIRRTVSGIYVLTRLVDVT